MYEYLGANVPEIAMIVGMILTTIALIYRNNPHKISGVPFAIAASRQ